MKLDNSDHNMYSKFYIPIHIYTVLQNVAGKLFFDPKHSQLKEHREIWKKISAD